MVRGRTHRAFSLAWPSPPLTVRGVGHVTALGTPFLRREKMQGERVHRPFHLLGQRLVDGLVAPHRHLALEGVGHQHQFEVGFRVGRHIVPVAFVFQFQVRDRQGVAHFAFNGLGHGHRGTPEG